MSETYVPFPTPLDIKENFYQLEICQNYEGFRVLLQNSVGAVFRISFDDLMVYRATDEGKRLLSLEKLKGINNTYLYKVEKSSFINWFLEENLNKQFRDSDLKHWAIITPNDWIDVIALDSEPKINKL
jgi:hypothetical protein